MGTSVFSIGISGLNAANSALSVASHNISNVNTPGYNRQVTQQAARSPQSEGYGFVGKGVDITSVSRVYDSYLDNQVKSAQSLSSYFTSQLDFMNQLDSLMADQDVGLSPAMQGFFSSLQTLSADPASIPARQTVINSAQALATKFRSLDTRLEEIHSGVNKHMEAAVDSINTLADKIATLNQQITALTAGDEVVVPNDLLDQRDQVVLELNKYIKASVVTERDGTYNVFIGNGQTLVLGAQSYGLTTQPDPADPRELQIAYVTSSGTNAPLSSKLLQGGELGGVLTFRDGALLEAETRLGDLAIDFSSTLNYQHELGVDLEGNAGEALFADLSGFAATPRDATGAFKVVLGDPKTLAVASNMKFESGSLAWNPASTTPLPEGLAVTGVWATLPGDYGWTSATQAGAPDASTHPANLAASFPIAVDTTAMTATMNGVSYAVVSDSAVSNGYKLVTTGAPAQDVGVSFKMSGQLPSGLTFNIVQNAAPIGSGDNGNLLEMVKLQTRQLVDDDRSNPSNSLLSFQSQYGAMVSYIGNVTNELQLNSAGQDKVLEQVTLAKESVSGVNLDEEAGNLLKYQQAYQASSKVIQIAQDIFSRLLEIG